MASNKFLQWAEQAGGKISLIHALVISLIFAGFSMAYHQGGILHPEMETYLPYYLSDKPLLNKLYDSKALDLNLFQARELSYLFDFLDSKFVELTVNIGRPQFLSIVHYLFSIAIGCMLWLFAVKELKLNPLTGLGLLALFWTSPSIFLGGIIFRTAKIGVALLIAALYVYLYKFSASYKSGDRPHVSTGRWVLYFTILFCMTLFDKQGVYLNITAIIFAVIWGIKFRDRNLHTMILIGTASLLLHELYNYVVAPQLTLMLNGYLPNFSYQALPVQKLLQNLPNYLIAGIYLYVETFRFLIGNPPFAVGIILLVLAIFFPIFYARKYPAESAASLAFVNLAFLAVVATNCLMVIAMNTLMVLRHPPLMWPDVSRVYYWLPTNIMLVMTLAVLVKLLSNARVLQRLIVPVMVLAIAGNIAALPSHKVILTHGHLAEYYQSGPLLLDALARLDVASDAPNPSVAENPVYKFFKSRDH